MPVHRLRDAALLIMVGAYSTGYATFGLSLLFLSGIGEVLLGRWRWVRSSLDLPLAALVLVMLLSGAVSPWPRTALLSAAAFAVIAVTAVRATLAFARQGPPAVSGLLLVWIAGGAAAALWGLWRGGPCGAPAASTAILEQNGLGSTLALALVLAVGTLSSGAARRPVLLASAAVLLLGGLTVTLARASWVGAAAGLLTLLFTGGPRARRVLAAGLLATALGAAALFSVCPQLSAEARSIPLLQANRNRLSIWSTALRIAADRPLLGTGFGTFPLAYPRYRPAEAPDPFAHFAHNILLNFAAETGLVGLAAFLVFCAVALRAMVRWWRRAPPDGLPRGMASAVLAATVTLMVIQLFDGTVMFVHLGVGLFVLFALAGAGERGDPA